MGKIKGIFIAVGSAISSFLGILFIPVLLMVLCNFLDYITGIFAAPKRGKKINSSIGWHGIVKKVCMWLLVVVGVIIDELISYAINTIGWDIPFTFVVACIVCIWIICNELLSILENLKDIGVPLPAFLAKIVVYIKSKAEQKADIMPKEGDNDEGKSE